MLSDKGDLERELELQLQRRIEIVVELDKKKRKVKIAPREVMKLPMPERRKILKRGAAHAAKHGMYGVKPTNKDILCGSFSAVGNPAAVEFYREIAALWNNFKKIVRILK